MSADPIGVGIVGMGNSGWFYHAEGTLEHSPDYTIAAVSARTTERTDAAARRFAARGHSTWRSLIDDPAVQLVVVATPHHLHEPIAVAALGAGKDVVVEKPMAVTAAETSRMIAAANRAGRLLTVFQNRRWEPTFQLIRELVAAGEIGEVWRVEERRMHAGKYTVSGDRAHAGTALAQWAHTTAGGGGVGYLIAPHLIDHQVVLHGSRPESVAALTHTYPGDEVEHYLDLRLRFPGARDARIEIFRENAVDLPKWAVYGTRGTIICPDFETLRLDRSDGTTRRETGLRPLQACDEFYEALAVALRDGGPPPVDPVEAAVVVDVLEAAHRSAAAGGAVMELE
ncbi:Gfo/Idh/MocA family protein [Occultella kanbiaonis]|uniref:Gfo/Idh/MocA family protein n=1 Tax=Occultella kanbiaonis TaxID=2675754 RepID=UPI0012B770D4|nr:Gfo/Idh/MocA family oxidoreductase [Occultella kanbiaonis]